MEEAEGDVDVVFGDAKDSVIEDICAQYSAAKGKKEKQKGVYF